MRILIVGTPRTGSTNFAEHISKNKNCIRVGEIFNSQTFKKRLARQKVDINEWECFKNDQKELEELEQMAKFQIKMFKEKEGPPSESDGGDGRNRTDVQSYVQ